MEIIVLQMQTEVRLLSIPLCSFYSHILGRTQQARRCPKEFSKYNADDVSYTSKLHLRGNQTEDLKANLVKRAERQSVCD